MNDDDMIKEVRECAALALRISSDRRNWAGVHLSKMDHARFERLMLAWAARIDDSQYDDDILISEQE